MPQLIAILERTVYVNEENGYTVARVRPKGMKRGTITVIGTHLSAYPGETLELEGEWEVDKKYGEQFRVRSFRSLAPASSQAMEKYLASGLIKGIGPFLAKNLVKKFGVNTLQVIEETPRKLLKVKGIGQVRTKLIHQAVMENREIRELMLFMHMHYLPGSLAIKVYRKYGEKSLSIIKDDPYRLAEDIFGVGFKTADKVALGLGLPTDSVSRAEASLIYILGQLAGEGHVYCPEEELARKASELLGVDISLPENAINLLAQPGREKIVIEKLLSGERAVYSLPLYWAEVNVARRILHLLHFPHLVKPPADLDGVIEAADAGQGICLSATQRQALARMVGEKMVIITGGPGTGKTTLVKTFLAIAEKMGRKVLLAAPTGRAAKRLSETTGQEAKTIHRLLEFTPAGGKFKRDEKNLLRGDVVLVDEASMVDLILMNNLLKAIPVHASLILVGDVDQLPSVGPGNVLKELIASNQIPVVRLTEIFRQSEQSLIISNAHRINSGQLPYQPQDQDEAADFFFIEKEEPEEILEVIKRLTTKRIPERFGFDPINDIQVISPMHRGLVGAQNLNLELKNCLNPGGAEIPFGNRILKQGDKVMQLRNNYDLDIFNGDIGRVQRIDREEQKVTVKFYDRLATIEFRDLDDLTLAYAITVHKSQGSEYPAVIMPLITQHYMMLQRNLVYTALTRAKKLMVIIGTKKALAMAIKNDTIERRFTNLKLRLTGEPSTLL